ncbi:LuxR C-terminal-related transcriptional regulator [Streptomyces viridochromogenes]|uniref:helix-turn-helix transcriptional regulator n=1 Tax=Streptomyces viridochromogenes TaxID=1938 RepID=UPI003CC7E9E4
MQTISTQQPSALALNGRTSGELGLLVEREESINTLRRLLTDTAAGRGRVAVVHGPLAVGKSRLLHGFLESIDDPRTLVLRASASRQERQLPFGVLRQFFQTTQVPNSVRDELDDVLTAMTLHEGRTDPATGSFSVETFGALQRIFRLLVDLTEHSRLVIGIDNLHHVDTHSLCGLLYLLPRLRDSCSLVALTDDVGRRPTSALLRSELLQQPNLHRIELGPLTHEGTSRLIAQELGGTSAKEFAHRFTAVSGGNPLVLQNLIGDHRAGLGPFPQGYGRALLSSLFHCEPTAIAVVRALAVLGDGTPAPALARLAGVSAAEADRVLRSLDSAGLLDGRAFRHAMAAADVLDDMPAQERAELHGRAAELLYREKAPTVEVAGQLLNAESTRAAWAGDVLRDAALHCLRAHRIREAVAHLELAEQTCASAPLSAAVRARISRLKWQVEPASAAPHLASLTADAAAGHLGTHDLTDLVWALAWHGDLGTASRLLSEVRDRRTARHGHESSALQDLRFWLTSMYPAYAGERRPTARGLGMGGDPPQPNPQTAAAELADALIRGHAATIRARAEQALNTARPDTDSLWSGEVALLALLCLVYTDQLEEAADWCVRLLDDARTRGSATWLAVFTAVQAEILLRGGELQAAAERAEEALARMPAGNWGAALGLLKGCLVLAHVRTGRLDRAAAHLAQPPSETMLQSRYGLHYLYARGHYRLATGQAQSALADFLSCGKLMHKWAVQGTGPVPWRTGAAEAWLALGKQDQARLLLRDELSRLPAGGSRARGLSLRLMAAGAAGAERPRLLSEAVEVFKECGDKFGLALALADLCLAHKEAGDHRTARRVARKAWHMAKACGAEALCEEIAYKPADGRATAPVKDDQRTMSALSEQEQRVASLAGEGYTNQEIADQLFITTSTVEQHLTRVFRKLKVKRRQDLPCHLETA